MDLVASKEQFAAAHELIAAINPRVWLGHYELWEDGEIIFRHGMALMTEARFAGPVGVLFFSWLLSRRIRVEEQALR